MLRCLASVLVLLALGSCPLLLAQEDGFVALVHGDSLKDWKGDLDSWQAKDGVLIGHADGSLRANRFIVSDIGPVKNFELRADVWVSAGGNSGLQYRSQERPDLGPFVVTGYQCDVVSNNDNYNGMLYEERGRRILSHTGEKVVIDASGQPFITGKMPVKHFAPGEWHQFRVLVEGNHHRHWIDGEPTADVVDLDEKKRSLSGIIGVQVHVGPAMEIRYRNMRLKRLPDDLPILTATDAPIPANAAKVEPQGGWKQAGVFDLNAVLMKAELGDLMNVHRAGEFWISNQPAAEDFKSIFSQGIRTVISARKPDELDWNERQIAENTGLTFVELPFHDPEELTDAIFEQTAQLLRQTPSDQQVLLHCSSGNRIGALWLVHRVLNGRVAFEQARQEAARIGLVKPEFEQKAVDYLTRKKRI